MEESATSCGNAIASLTYTGINKHQEDEIGLYDTVISREDAKKVFENVPAALPGPRRER